MEYGHAYFRTRRVIAVLWVRMGCCNTPQSFSQFTQYSNVCGFGNHLRPGLKVLCENGCRRLCVLPYSSHESMKQKFKVSFHNKHICVIKISQHPQLWKSPSNTKWVENARRSKLQIRSLSSIDHCVENKHAKKNGKLDCNVLWWSNVIVVSTRYQYWLCCINSQTGVKEEDKLKNCVKRCVAGCATQIKMFLE